MKTKIFALTIALLVVELTALYAQDRGNGWPSATILKEYGLEGMSQPAGATEVWWRRLVRPEDMVEGLIVYRNTPTLIIGFHGTNATAPAIRSWFERMTPTGSRAGVYYYAKGAALASYEFSDGIGHIRSGIRKSGAWPNAAAWGRFGINGLTAPPGAIIGEVEDDGAELSVEFYSGGNAAYVNLRNQLIAKMGQPSESEGGDRDNERSDSFWNAKTSVAVFTGKEDETFYIRAEQF